MTDTPANPNRVPPGVPTGGQFAASAKSEADVPLPTSPSGLGTGEFVQVTALDEGDRFVFAWGNGSPEGDKVVTFISAFQGDTMGDILISVQEQDDYVILADDDEVELAAPIAPRPSGDPWATPPHLIPEPKPDPWSTLGHPGATDDEYTLPADAGYGATRQTSAPIRPSKTSVDPRRAKGFYEMIRDGEVNLNPPYQRASVWSMDQRCGLIRSFLSQTPVPAVLINNRRTPAWAAANDGDTALETPYVVIDGKQRLETVRAWFAGEFGVPKSWFADDEVVDYFQTPDGPYVNYHGLAMPVRRDFDQNAILPVGEASLATIEEEAEMYVRVNSAGTEQTAADMANAQAWADGTINDRDRHQCGFDYDPSCDGCRAADSDGGYAGRGF